MIRVYLYIFFKNIRKYFRNLVLFKLKRMGRGQLCRVKAMIRVRIKSHNGVKKQKQKRNKTCYGFTFSTVIVEIVVYYY